MPENETTGKNVTSGLSTFGCAGAAVTDTVQKTGLSDIAAFGAQSGVGGIIFGKDFKSTRAMQRSAASFAASAGTSTRTRRPA